MHRCRAGNPTLFMVIGEEVQGAGACSVMSAACGSVLWWLLFFQGYR